ncbi:MAG: hypothetical protein Q9O62_11165 [Ardenticatenia bacterium]|nr:hypothetical protein [Ardenticatenia bacterium]
MLEAIRAFINADTWTESRRVLEAHPELLSDEADDLLGQLAEAQEDERARRLVEQHRALLRRCREVGVDRAFAEMTTSPQHDIARLLAEAGDLGRTLRDFIAADTWTASRRILEQHPELLSDDADALLGRLIDAARHVGAQGTAPDEDTQRLIRTLEQHRALLRRCRDVGVDRAFAEIVGAQRATPPIPPEFQDDLRRAQEAQRRYLQTGDVAALDEAVAAWERILNHPAFPQAEERFRLTAMNDAGGAYLRRYWARGQLPDLDRALDLWQQALAVAREGSPDWASMQANLGVALSTRFEALGQVADLDAAIQAFRRPSPSPARAPRLGRHQARPTPGRCLPAPALRPWARWPTWTPPIRAFQKALSPSPARAPPTGPDGRTISAWPLRTRFEALGPGGRPGRRHPSLPKGPRPRPRGAPRLGHHAGQPGRVPSCARFEALGQVADPWTPPSRSLPRPSPSPAGAPRLGHQAGQPGPVPSYTPL